jgi:ABC-type nitrate/sulfonate/bicarbonate transport system substrate-binding protein
MRRRKTFMIAAAALALLAGIVASVAVFRLYRERQERGLEPITIAVARQAISAPVYLSYERGYFEREGLAVTLQQHWVGKEALDSVIGGKAQISTVTETPLVFAALRDEPILILATIGDSKKYMKIIARKDRGIAGPQDLRGKNIGVSMGTNAPYFLDSYLTFNGIAKNQVHVVPVKAERMTEALARGSIDAAVIWDPLSNGQSKLPGADTITLENDMIYQIYWNIVAEREYVQRHPETIKKVLRALLRAQHYMEEHPEEAQKIAARSIGDDIDLKDFNFDIRLAQSLILELEDQASWAIKNGLARKTQVPNFLNMMYVQGMQAVAPASITVIY